jgi:hypothetical protein
VKKYYLMRGQYCVGCDAGRIPAVVNKAFSSLYMPLSDYADVQFGEPMRQILEASGLDYSEFSTLLSSSAHKAIFINLVTGKYVGINGDQPIDGVVYVIGS